MHPRPNPPGLTVAWGQRCSSRRNSICDYRLSSLAAFRQKDLPTRWPVKIPLTWPVSLSPGSMQWNRGNPKKAGACLGSGGSRSDSFKFQGPVSKHSSLFLGSPPGSKENDAFCSCSSLGPHPGNVAKHSSELKNSTSGFQHHCSHSFKSWAPTMWQALRSAPPGSQQSS